MDANDPRLTAYALDELNDPASQAEVEAALSASPALAAEVDEIRRLAVCLKQAIAAQAPPASSTIRSAVEATLANGQAAPAEQHHSAGNRSAAAEAGPSGNTDQDGPRQPTPATWVWTRARNRAVAAVAAIVVCAAALTLMFLPGITEPLASRDSARTLQRTVMPDHGVHSSRQHSLRELGEHVPFGELPGPASAPEAAPTSRFESAAPTAANPLEAAAPRNMPAPWYMSDESIGFGGMGGGGRFGRGMTLEGLGVNSDAGVAGNVVTDTTANPKAAEPHSGGPAATWRRSEVTPNASRLMIGENEELPLQAMEANVQVDGFRARVLIDLYYYNDRDRRYEGTFKIRLPSDASLYFLAFGETVYKTPHPPELTSQAFFSVERTRDLGSDPAEIMLARSETWKEPKEARVVPKEKAAHSYRETVRRRVDPALAEWAGAGVFSARVFPLVPKAWHRIVIGYDVNLLAVGDELLYRLDLPRSVPQVLVDLRATDYAGRPPQVTPARRGEKPSLVRGQYHYRFENPTAPVIELRQSASEPLLLTGRDDKLGDFFAARLRVPETDAPKAGAYAGRAAKRALFMVDTSLSAAPDRMNIYLDLLKAMLDGNRDTIQSFQVQFFNVESHTWRSGWVPNTPGNVAAAVEYAQSLALEGATDLEQALRFAGSLLSQEGDSGSPRNVQSATAQPANAQPADVFLLTDGSATWGATNTNDLIALVPAQATLFAYTTGMSGDDTLLLSRLTQATGGAHFAVTGENAVDSTARAHRSRPWLLKGITIPGGTDLLVAGRPVAVYPGQTLLVAGRGNPEDASITLHLARDGQEETISLQSRQVASELAPRIYGQVATDSLEAMHTAVEDVAVAYARHFRVPGQTCSLLMLETEADYQRFGIKPEEDALVVQLTPAMEAIRAAEQRHEELQRSAKAAFEAYLDRLTKMPGMDLEVPPVLRIAINRLPEESFRLVRRPLDCKQRMWRDLPAAHQDEVLSSRPLDYSQITKEADRRFRAASADDALKALSSLVELDPGNVALARDIAYSAMEWGLADQAYVLLQRVAAARPYEPHTYQAMAQCLAAAGKADLAMVYYELAVGGRWGNRFREFNSIASFDYLRLLKQIDRGESPAQLRPLAQQRQQALQTQHGLDQADLVVMIAWNTDGTDVDLHVTEPTGEVCYYSHPQTRIGGRLTQDVTEGLGPEMYVLPKARPGEYVVFAHYFADDTNRASTRTRVFATVYRNWGTEREVVERATVTLESGRQMHRLMRIMVK